MKEGHAALWNIAIKRLKFRMNLISLFDQVSIPVFYAGTLGAFVVYFMRRLGFPIWYMVLVPGLLIAGCMIWGCYKTRDSLFRDVDARAFLDEQMGLHGALSAASERDVNVPDFAFHAGKTYKWTSFRSFYWMMAGVCLFLLGAVLPVSKGIGAPRPVVAIPPALAQVEEWIGQLEEQGDIDDASIEPLREQMNEFLKKTNEELYTHSSLEASDALKAHAENTMMEFAKGLENLNFALNEMASQLNKGRDADAKDLTDAFESMENNALKPSGQLANALSAVDPSMIKQLSPEQMKQIMEKLKEASDCMNEMCQNGSGSGIVDPDNPQYKLVDGDGAGMGEGEGEPIEIGEGTPERGRGDAPLLFSDQPSERITNNTENVTSDDMSRAAIGDLAGIQRGGHEVAPDQTHEVEQSGAASQPAQGGEAVWRDNVTPREQEALQTIFN